MEKVARSAVGRLHHERRASKIAHSRTFASQKDKCRSWGSLVAAKRSETAPGDQGEMMRSLAIAFVLATVSGCPHPSDPEPASVARPDEVLDFGLYWPPQDPQAPEGPAGDPLLLGQLRVHQATSPQGDTTHSLSIELTRRDDEEHR